MLGIDINEHSIQIVNLRWRSGGFVIQPPLEVPYDTSDRHNPEKLGILLNEALKSRGWLKYRAVMTLPARLSFVRRLMLNNLPSENQISLREGHISKNTMEHLVNLSRQSMMVSTDELVLDLWTKPHHKPFKDSQQCNNDGVLLGAARKVVVEFCRELASHADIKLQSLELRSMAAINGLLMNWHEAQEENILVVYADSQQTDVALIDCEGLVSLQTIYYSTGSSSSKNESNTVILMEQLPRVLNTMRLSHGECLPEKIFLGTDLRTAGTLPEVITQLKQKVGLELVICSAGEDITLAGSRDKQTETPPALSDFIPAIGAALDGLAVSPTWFNFLHPRGRFSSKKKPLSWKPFALTVVAAILFAVAFWVTLVHQKIAIRNNLDTQLQNLEPKRQAMLNDKNNWLLFRPFLSTSQDGNRLSYLDILYEISAIMPETTEAYVTNLTIINSNASSVSSSYDIMITGHSSQNEVVTRFVERLNALTLFRETKQGSRTVDTRNVHYPVSFSLTCKLR